MIDSMDGAEELQLLRRSSAPGPSTRVHERVSGHRPCRLHRRCAAVSCPGRLGVVLVVERRARRPRVTCRRWMPWIEERKIGELDPAKCPCGPCTRSFRRGGSTTSPATQGQSCTCHSPASLTLPALAPINIRSDSPSARVHLLPVSSQAQLFQEFHASSRRRRCHRLGPSGRCHRFPHSGLKTGLEGA